MGKKNGKRQTGKDKQYDFCSIDLGPSYIEIEHILRSRGWNPTKAFRSFEEGVGEVLLQTNLSSSEVKKRLNEIRKTLNEELGGVPRDRCEYYYELLFEDILFVLVHSRKQDLDYMVKLRREGLTRTKLDKTVADVELIATIVRLLHEVDECKFGRTKKKRNNGYFERAVTLFGTISYYLGLNQDEDKNPYERLKKAWSGKHSTLVGEFFTTVYQRNPKSLNSSDCVKWIPQRVKKPKK